MQFIRVKDPETGHEFDVPETDWRIGEGIFVPIKSDRYPPIDRARRPKHQLIQPKRATNSKEPK